MSDDRPSGAWPPMSNDPVKDIEEAVRLATARALVAPCLHPFIQVSLSDLDGRPCNPRCTACGKPFPISTPELERMLREQEAATH